MLTTLLAVPVLFAAVPVYPDPADVRTGVQYGPTGAEYTGTLVGGGGLTTEQAIQLAAVYDKVTTGTVSADVVLVKGNPDAASGLENLSGDYYADAALRSSNPYVVSPVTQAPGSVAPIQS